METNFSQSQGMLKCNHCPECLGFGCIGELPGLGGVFQNKNFQLNCQAWKDLQNLANQNNTISQIKNIQVLPSMVRCGPVTGAQENIGYNNEEDFYFPYLNNAAKNNIGICVGDGYPDHKLHYGVNAMKKIATQFPQKKAAFFLKPYPQEKLFQRIDLVLPHAEYIGIDIDSYNIVTMRNLVNLEQKTAEQLLQIKNKINVPFVIKGIFTQKDLELVQKVQPDVVYISNHGGRVETEIGSSADFLVKNAQLLKNYCKEIWIDGGIRSKLDIQTAIFYGASQVIMARPFIHATFNNTDYSSLFN